jgi:hypothetical protein
MNAMNSHSLAYIRDPEQGIAVPVTTIALEDSPTASRTRISRSTAPPGPAATR